jgi:ABC-type phosphate transport system substrate-binding protein
MTVPNKTQCFLLAAVLHFACAARAQDVVIVANRAVQESSITSADLRDLFTGVKTRFRDGSRAMPVVLKGGPAHEVFLRHHLGEGPDEFRAAWRKAVFTGQGSMLRAFDSEAALLQFVAATPGAIGYVSRVSTQDLVKTLIVINRY